MIITAELSLYPLSDEFEKPVIDFIRKLRETEHVEIHTHSMSTFVRGDSKQVFSAIQEALDHVSGSTDTLSLVIKIINRPLYPEKTKLDF